MVTAAKKGKPAVLSKMTDQMRAFANEYCTDFNGTKAAIRAGYKASSARSQASILLAREDVQALVEEKMKRIEVRTDITAERALQEAWGIATADVNALVEFRRTCCRHCYGVDYGYQRTIQEMNRDRRAYEKQRAKDEKKADFDPLMYEEFDEKGGIGWDARKPPNPDCQECFGDGVGDAFFKDTRNLSPEALAAYAGVKQTKDGYQMLLVDKLGGLEKVFKHLGLYKADNKQKADALLDFVQGIQARGSKLPIKPQQ